MKIKLFLIFTLFILTLGGILFYRQKTEKQKAQAPTMGGQAKPLSQPTFPDKLSQEQPSYSLQLPLLDFPIKLSLYEVRPVSLESFGRSIAKSLGFSTAPTVINNSRGYFYVWNQTPKLLVVGGDPVEVSYSSGFRPAGSISSSPGQYVPVVNGFIKKLGTLSASIELVAGPPSYFAPDEKGKNSLPGPDGATLVELNYRYHLDGRPLFTRLPSTPSLSVQINTNNEVVSAAGYWFAEITKLPAQADVVSYQFAVQRLVNKQGALVETSAEVDKNTENVGYYNVSLTNVSSATLGYYYSAGSKELAPVFVFGGSGRDTEGKEVKTTTLVSALP